MGAEWPVLWAVPCFTLESSRAIEYFNLMEYYFDKSVFRMVPREMVAAVFS